MASFPTTVFSKADIANGAVSDATDVNDLSHEIAAIEDGYLNGTARISCSNATLNGTAAFSTGFTERGRSVRAGEWSTFTGTFGSTAGTWTVANANADLEYIQLGKSLWVTVNISASTVSAVTDALTLGLPSTFVSANLSLNSIRLFEHSSEALGIMYSNAGSTSITIARSGASISSGPVIIQGQLLVRING